MAAFFGTYTRNIDDKQRLPLPREFRDVLGAESGIVTRLGGALTLHTASAFESMTNRLEDEVRSGDRPMAMLRRITKNAYPVRPDGQNRIKLPKQILQEDELSGELVMMGTYSRVEIRPPARHAEVDAESEAVGAEAEDYV
jgi:division/cell wall cluster transcriptional repressor MraZ